MDLQQALTALKNNDTTTIALSDIRMDEASLDALCDALEGNTQLKTLEIEDADINEAGARVLAKALEGHRGIERLTLDDNPLTTEGVEALLAVYRSHPTLRKVSLAGVAGVTKAQRKQFSALNKARKAHKPHSTDTLGGSEPVAPSVVFPASLVEMYRDKLSKDEYFMAEPVIATKDGRTYERETLMNYLGYTVVMTGYADKAALQDALGVPTSSQTWHLLYDRDAQQWYVNALDVGGEQQQGRLDEHPALSALLESHLLKEYAAGSSLAPVALAVLPEEALGKSAQHQGPSVDEVTQLLGKALGYHRWCQHPTRNTDSPYTRESLEGTDLVENQDIKSQIQDYLSTQPALWHDTLDGVYLPEGWQWRVLAAIKTGESEVLDRYWSRHPGLVTRGYAHRGDERLHGALIETGTLRDFQHWMKKYEGYHKVHAMVPCLQVLFTEVDKHTGHAVHGMIAHQRGSEWYESLLPHLGWSGDYYHGLVHLHDEHTHDCDTAAMTTLLEQGLHPHGVDEQGRTPLVLSIQQEKYGLTSVLIHHSHLDRADKEGNTALHALAKRTVSEERDTLIVELLCRGAADTLTNHDNQTAEQILKGKEPGHYGKLMRAVQSRQRNRVQGLETKVTTLEQLALEFKQQLAVLTKSFETLLSEVQTLQTDNAYLKSLSTQRVEQTKAVLSEKAVQDKFYAPKKQYLRHLFLASTPELQSVDAAVKAFMDKQDALVAACTAGDLKEVKRLHEEEGASLDEPNRAGEYPLEAACRVLNVAIIDYIDEKAKEPENGWLEVTKRYKQKIKTQRRNISHVNEVKTISEISTYTQLKSTINMIDKGKHPHDISKLISEWESEWQKSDGDKGQGYSVSHHLNCTNKLPNNIPITAKYATFESRSYRHRKDCDFTSHYSDSEIWIGLADRKRPGVQAARMRVTRCVNQCINEMKALHTALKRYEARMEESERLLSQRSTTVKTP